MSADASNKADQNVQQIVLALGNLDSHYRQLQLQFNRLLRFFDGNPQLRRSNVYVTKTIDLTTAQSPPKILFDATSDNGGFPMENLYVLTLSDSVAVAHLFINSASDLNPLTVLDIAGFTPGAVPLTATPANPFRNFDIDQVWFDVTTAHGIAPNLCKIVLTGWVK